MEEDGREFVINLDAVLDNLVNVGDRVKLLCARGTLLFFSRISQQGRVDPFLFNVISGQVTKLRVPDPIVLNFNDAEHVKILD